jgi:hypothetical protein
MRWAMARSSRIGGGSGNHLRSTLVNPGDAEFGCKLLGPAAIEIADASDREARQLVGGQVGIVDDPASADDADRARADRKRGLAGYVHRHSVTWTP